MYSIYNYPCQSRQFARSGPEIILTAGWSCTGAEYRFFLKIIKILAKASHELASPDPMAL
jgi:hypothetical protein